MKKSEWWQLRYGTTKGVSAYINTYKEILNDKVSTLEINAVIKLVNQYQPQKSIEFDSPILDGFCGNARHAKSLFKQGFTNITAFDYSMEMLKKAKKIQEDWFC